jgi:predicted metal-dependent hydrolase
MAHVKLGDIAIDVRLKDIKNVHLSVYPPTGEVRISAPSGMNLDTIRMFAVSKLGWIKQQQRKFRQQERETQREFLERESHYVWGERRLLRVVESGDPPAVYLEHNALILKIYPETSIEARQAIVAQWYRHQVKVAVPPLIAKWEPLTGVKVARVFLQEMKTKWGSCNPGKRSIRLNTELAKKPPECLEYIVLHEMVHLLEPTHNRHFVALMDRFMPNWERYRQQLNELPARYERRGNLKHCAHDRESSRRSGE